MRKTHDYYPECPEALIVSLARTGDRGAYAELVRRRQSQVRNLMRHCCGDPTLADDLSQQVFLKVWLGIRTLKRTSAFSAWLKRLAINVWLQHLRKNDALHNATEFDDFDDAQHDTKSVGLDLASALATLPALVRTCVVLSYHNGMNHPEIAKITGLPLGTVKSHVRRGSQRLQQLLAAYTDKPEAEKI